MSKRAKNTDIARRAQDKGPAPTGDWLRRMRRCLSRFSLKAEGGEGETRNLKQK